MVTALLFIYSGSGWESNPPRPATRPATGFEDQEAHRDLTTPTYKHNLPNADSQVMLILDSISLLIDIPGSHLPDSKIKKPNSIARNTKGGYNASRSNGAWRSPVARLHGVQEVAGSNPVAPTATPFNGYK